MVRRANIDDIPQINVIRKQVHQIHVNARPDKFNPDFSGLESQPLLYLEEGRDLFVAERDGRITGVCAVEYVHKPESPYRPMLDYAHIVEFGVDEAWRRKGVGHELMEYVKEEAGRLGFNEIQLDVWAFNDAVHFYEAEGFSVFREYMEWKG